MQKTSIQLLAELGQSAWLDYIDRRLLESGRLKGLIEKGLRGMTSNPSIFNQAIGTSSDYDDKILQFKSKGKSTFEIYDELTIRDIQDATDQFRATYDETQYLDGYVSLEINPQLANKVDEQIKEGLRLFQKVNRPNLMIKVPSTEEGFPVIEELLANGINVNVTLIFSLKQYEQTAQAYVKGLSRFLQKGGDVSRVYSVASVFVSRIDTTIDPVLDQKIKEEQNAAKQNSLKALKGKAAVANARVIYERYRELFASKDFDALSKNKANIQRVLWGSTSTKNPEYSDIKYVTEIIAPDTVNTLPENTLNAFLDHGKVQDAFIGTAVSSKQIISDLKKEGIDINQVCSKLLEEGVSSFNKAFESLMTSIDKKAVSLCVKS